MTEDPELKFSERLINWLAEKPTLLFVIGFVSVSVLCLCSQVLVRFSKQSNISLNNYYRRKKFDKLKQMQNIIERYQLEQLAINPDEEFSNLL